MTIVVVGGALRRRTTRSLVRECCVWEGTDGNGRGFGQYGWRGSLATRLEGSGKGLAYWHVVLEGRQVDMSQLPSLCRT